MSNELIKIDLQALKKLDQVKTYQLENLFTIINNKDMKAQVANELLKRNDLHNYKIVVSGGNVKINPVVKPKQEFINKFLDLCEDGTIKLVDYLNWNKIISEYDKVFSKDLFNVELVKEQTKKMRYIRKK